MPENINLITICIDGEEETDLAKEIIASVDGRFMALRQSDSLEENLIQNIEAVPTSVFVDAKGNIIGEAQIGAPGKGDELVSKYSDIINERLDLIRK